MEMGFSVAVGDPILVMRCSLMNLGTIFTNFQLEKGLNI